jgi:hypothetical protein
MTDNFILMPAQSFRHGEYVARPSVQATAASQFQGVVVIAAQSGEEEASRHVLQERFDNYHAALSAATSYAWQALHQISHAGRQTHQP